MEALKIRDQANLTLAKGSEENSTATALPTIDGRERIRIEFYKTYDVMTGIRIAATLGGKKKTFKKKNSAILIVSYTLRSPLKN